MNRLQIFELSFCDVDTPQQTNVQGGGASFSSSHSQTNDAGISYSSALSIIHYNNNYIRAVYAAGTFNQAAAVAISASNFPFIKATVSS